jgi:hypothetical protein
MEPTGPLCAVKIRLLQEYLEATQMYAVVLGEFNRRLAAAPTEDYSKLNRMVDKARRQSEEARDRLAQHIAEDHC